MSLRAFVGGTLLLAAACSREQPTRTVVVAVTATPASVATATSAREPALVPMESANFDFPLAARPTDEQRIIQAEISRIDAEIEIQKAKIVAQEVDAASSGGLVGALSAATLATMKQTLAMLEQRRVRLEEQLPPGMAPTRAAAPRREVPVPLAPSQAPVTDRESDLKIVDIQTRVTESNDSWDRVAWRLTLKNYGARDRTVNCDLEFQDEAGFVVKTAPAYGLYLPGGRTETFTGDTLIGADVRGNVARVVGKAR
jgi:hypothetical protein